MYNLIIIKNFSQLYKKISHTSNIKKMFCLLNIMMVNLSFDELRLIAQLRNMSDYENNSKEDLIKPLSEPETPKPKTPKTPEPEPKIRTKTDKRKLKNLRNG